MAALLTASVWLPACAGRIRCGPVDCSASEECCNDGCGICTAPGEACIIPLCPWGRPESIDPEHVPTSDVYDRISAGVEYTRLRVAPEDAPALSSSGPAVRASVQHYAGPDLAVRARLSTTRLASDGAEAMPVPGRTGWTAGAGASYLLPAFMDFVSWAATADAEYRHGPAFASALTPAALGSGEAGTAGLGLAFLHHTGRLVPLTAHLRYIHTFAKGSGNEGLVDVGAGVSKELDWIQRMGGPDLPIGLRLSYRYSHALFGRGFHAHEVGGGLFFFRRPTVRLGVETSAGFSTLPDGQARSLTGLARFDYYWDANL